MDPKPTIFIAHSSLDLVDARLVRNIFEDRNHDVLLLKLSQQMTNDFLETLLRREIQARDWIVVLASENSRKSAWVDFEQRHARERNKPIFYIELEKCRKLEGAPKENCLIKQVANISRAIRVFISYSKKDRGVAARMARDLRARGYEVWDDAEMIAPGADWQDEIRNGIEWALEKGALVILLSSFSEESKYVRQELDYALSSGGRIIPCVIDPPPRRIFLEIMNLQYVDLSRSYEQGFQRLIKALG